MPASINRREMLASAATLVALPLAAAQSRGAAVDEPLPLPLVDYHTHRDNSTLDRILALSKAQGVRYGVVEHAGTKENVYPVVLSSDTELDIYTASLAGTGVYKGVQAEWTDWAGCFSKASLGRLDYVLTDAMTMPGKDGRRVKLWEPGAAEQVDFTPEPFMDRYVDWHLEILDTQPIDLLVNVSWLPDALAPRYDALWTEPRIQKIVDALKRHAVALEISASFKVPSLAFLKQARAAGLTFALGSNGRYPNMGKLDHALEKARALELTAADLFTPPAAGPRAAR